MPPSTPPSTSCGPTGAPIATSASPMPCCAPSPAIERQSSTPSTRCRQYAGMAGHPLERRLWRGHRPRHRRRPSRPAAARSVGQIRPRGLGCPAWRHAHAGRHGAAHRHTQCAGSGRLCRRRLVGAGCWPPPCPRGCFGDAPASACSTSAPHRAARRRSSRPWGPRWWRSTVPPRALSGWKTISAPRPCRRGACGRCAHLQRCALCRRPARCALLGHRHHAPPPRCRLEQDAGRYRHPDGPSVPPDRQGLDPARPGRHGWFIPPARWNRRRASARSRPFSSARPARASAPFLPPNSVSTRP
jgi:hypothetical protein